MKKLVVVFTIVTSVIGFTSCTDLNETNEQLIEQQEIQGIDPDDDGTIKDTDPDDDGEI